MFCLEAVGDLTRLRRAFMSALGERTAAIAADDLDAQVLLEPARRHACRTIRQKIDHLTPLQAHDDGPISGALAPRPIIKAHIRMLVSAVVVCPLKSDPP